MKILVTEQMFNKVRDACKYRPLRAKIIFQGEMSGLPECFVKKDGTPYHNPKSKILVNIIEGCITPVSNVEGLIVDLSVIISAQAAILPNGVFNELLSNVLQNIANTARRQGAGRIDLVAD